MHFDPGVDMAAPTASTGACGDAILRDNNALKIEIGDLTRQHSRADVAEAAYARYLADINADSCPE